MISLRRYDARKTTLGQVLDLRAATVTERALADLLAETEQRARELRELPLSPPSDPMQERVSDSLYPLMRLQAAAAMAEHAVLLLTGLHAQAASAVASYPDDVRTALTARYGLPL